MLTSEPSARRAVVVGVNAYTFDRDTNVTPDILRVDPAVEAAQRERLARLRANRDNGRVRELLGHVETAARGSENLVPLFIACVENGATLGEICGVLRGVFGEYRPSITL